MDKVLLPPQLTLYLPSLYFLFLTYFLIKNPLFIPPFVTSEILPVGTLLTEGLLEKLEPFFWPSFCARIFLLLFP